MPALSRKSKRMRSRVWIGIGALLFTGGIGWGVYATGFSLTGTRGASLISGGDERPAQASGCQTNTISVSQQFSSGLDPSAGYELTVGDYVVSGVDSEACEGKRLHVAVLFEGENYRAPLENIRVVEGQSTYVVSKHGASPKRVDDYPSGYSLRMTGPDQQD